MSATNKVLNKFSFYSISMIVSKILAVVVIVLVSRKLGMDDFSKFDKYINTALMLLPVVTLCLPESVYNYLNQKKIVLSYSLIIKIILLIFITSFFIAGLINYFEGLNFIYIFSLLFLPACLFLTKQIYRVFQSKVIYILSEILLYFPPLIYLIICYSLHFKVTVYNTIISYISGYLLSLCVFYLFNNKNGSFISSNDNGRYIKFLLNYGIWLIPSGFLFNYFANSFRYFEINSELMLELTVIYRVSMYQVIINAVLFLGFQDEMYKALAKNSLPDKSFIAISVTKSILANITLVTLSYPVWWAFTNTLPSKEILFNVFLFNSVIMIYGWAALSSTIHNFYNKQKFTTFITMGVMIVYFSIVSNFPNYFMLAFICASCLIFILRFLFSYYLVKLKIL